MDFAVNSVRDSATFPNAEGLSARPDPMYLASMEVCFGTN